MLRANAPGRLLSSYDGGYGEEIAEPEGVVAPDKTPESTPGSCMASKACCCLSAFLCSVTKAACRKASMMVRRSASEAWRRAFWPVCRRLGLRGSVPCLFLRSYDMNAPLIGWATRPRRPVKQRGASFQDRLVEMTPKLTESGLQCKIHERCDDSAECPCRSLSHQNVSR